MSIGIQGIRQIAVTVSDMERAVAFYADTLGLDLRFRNDSIAFFDCGETRLLLGAKREEDADGIVVYFEVADIFAAVDGLRDAGIRIEKEAECLARMAGRAMWAAFFRDSEGALAALIAEHPDDSAGDQPAA